MILSPFRLSPCATPFCRMGSFDKKHGKPTYKTQIFHLCRRASTIRLSLATCFATLGIITLVAQNTLRRNAAGGKRNFQYAVFVLEFAGPLVSKRGFDPQYASVFDRYAASTRNLLDMLRFNFNTKFGKDKKPIKF